MSNAVSKKNDKRWERAAEEIIGSETKAAVDVLFLAGDIDRLAQRMSEHARSIAERAARYATDVEMGIVVTPMGSSDATELVSLHATYRAKCDAFWLVIDIAFHEHKTTLKAALKGGA